MKKNLLCALFLLLLLSLNYAQISSSYNSSKTIFPNFQTPKHDNPLRPEPAWNFHDLPFQLLHSYYDYMICGTNDTPICSPVTDFGGTFITYTGQRTANSTRRAFFTYVDYPGNTVEVNNELTYISTYNEQNTAVGMMPDCGKPFYAWDVAGADSISDVMMTWDAYLEQIPGLIADNHT
ncbi:MAG TPA: hypothetical protein PKK33_00885, partial [Candidatus Cloacimonadota bacterium]|nr:hypothetical protein [Candidatus Cloacimonadota bacterium]